MRKSFKKALSLVLALTLLMSMVCISNFAVSAESTQYSLGDANTDGNVDVMDATTIQQIAAKLVTPTDQQRYLADVTGDGEIDIRDATLIQQYIAMLLGDAPTNADGYKIGDLVTFGENPTSPSTSPSTDPQPTSESETQPTSESATEPQPTSESETQPSSEEQVSKYGLHMSDANGSNWKTNPMTVNGDVATVEMQLTAGTYRFKITDGDKWYGNNGTIKDTTTTTSHGGWVMSTDADNCKLNATGGTYTFAYTISTSKLIVTYVSGEPQPTSESVEETSESVEEPQPTSESSEETQPTSESETQPSSEEQTTKYGLHMSDANGSNWKTNPMTVNGDVATVEMQLTAGTYRFKITDGDKWYGNNGTIEDTTTKTSKGGWVMSTDAGNCKLEATGGTYTFAYTISTSKLIVTFVPEETQVTSESVIETSEETQATSESEEETSEETQATTESVATKTYTFYFAPLASDVDAGYNFVANILSDVTDDSWFPYEMTATGTTFNGLAVYAAEITVPETQNMVILQFQTLDGKEWKHQVLSVNNVVTPYSAFDGKIVVAGLDDKGDLVGEVKDYVADEETQPTSESETQPTTESSEETQPTSESSEETQPSSEEQVSKYSVHMSDANGSNWKTNAMTENGDVATVVMQLTAGTYEFKITDGTNWYGNNGTIKDTTTTTSHGGWVMETSAGNCKLEATGGTYTFAYTISTSKLIVTFVSDEPQPTSESVEETSESVEEPQPTTESSEETQPSSEEQVSKYGLHMNDANGSNWKTNAMTVNGDVATVEMQLTAGTYEFKITDGTNWYGNNGTIKDTTTTTSHGGWVMSTDADNCKLNATGGTYTFAYTISTSKLIVTFVPDEPQPTSESVEETSESVEEPQPTSESSEETQPSSEEQVSKYGLHMNDANGSNWKTNPMAVNGDVATVEMRLTAGTYEFKITDGTNWYGNNGTIADTTTTTSQHGWYMSENDGNCKLTATGGTYTFAYTISTSKLIVTFVPAETQATTPSEETPTDPTPTEPDPKPVASAYKVAGSFNDWGNSTDVMYYTSDEVVAVTITLDAGTHNFKITDGTNWYGNNGTIEDTTTTTSTRGWDMSTSDGDCKLNASGGTYTFTFNLSTKKLIIVKEA